jgi:hypothetical protein
VDRPPGQKRRREEMTTEEELELELELEELEELEGLSTEDCELLLWYDEALNLPDVE